MNKREKLYKNYVVVTGILTFALLIALFVALLGWLKGLVISMSFSSVIGLMIWQFLKKTKPWPTLLQDQSSPISDHLSIELRSSLNRLRTPWVKIGIFYAAFLGFMNLNFYFGADEVYAKVFPYFNLFFILMISLIVWIKTDHHRRALKLIGIKPRYLELDSKGMRVPIEILDEAALYKALKTNESEVFLAWQDIVKFEIYDKVGRSLPQFKIRCITGHPLTNMFDDLAIMRTPEIDREMMKIRNVVDQKVMRGK